MSKLELPRSSRGLQLLFGCAALGTKSSRSLALSMRVRPHEVRLAGEVRARCSRAGSPAARCSLSLRSTLPGSRRRSWEKRCADIEIYAVGPSSRNRTIGKREPVALQAAESNAVICAWLGWLMSRKRNSLVPFDPDIADLRHCLATELLLDIQVPVLHVGRANVRDRRRSNRSAGMIPSKPERRARCDRP